LSVVESMLNSCLDELSKYIKDSSVFTIVLVLFFILCIATFILFSIWFAVVFRRKIGEETNRQINERIMLYANIVHDLKTPMTIILSFSQALQDAYKLFLKQLHPDASEIKKERKPKKPVSEADKSEDDKGKISVGTASVNGTKDDVEGEKEPYISMKFLN